MSKVALVTLLERLRAAGFTLFDVQYWTPHLGQFGAVEISAGQYILMLRRALSLDVNFLP
jgi:leucyl/phenylalanyl-tRNA--protein transferase